MTELKDGIKKVVKDWMENEFDFVDVASDWATPDMSRTDEQRYDDLAQRIADALVVDEIKVTQIISDVGNATRYDDDIGGVKVNPILWSVVPSASAKAISNAKPIKCEVGGEIHS